MEVFKITNFGHLYLFGHSLNQGCGSGPIFIGCHPVPFLQDADPVPFFPSADPVPKISDPNSDNLKTLDSIDT